MSVVEATSPGGVDFTLREMVDQYEATLALMNAAANRITAKISGADKHPSVINDALAGNTYYARLSLAKKTLEVAMSQEIVGHPVYEWAIGVPGLNRVTISRVVALIPMTEPSHFYEFSRLQSFAGYAPGKDKLVRGQKATFNPRLKKALFVAIDTVLKSSGVVDNRPTRPERLYSEIYVNWRRKYAQRHGVGEKGRAWLKRRGFKEDVRDYDEYLIENNRPVLKDGEPAPVWPDPRQHSAARRKALIYMLAHLWRVWRTNLGWDYRPMYFHEQLHHEFQEDCWLYHSSVLADKKRRERFSMPELDQNELDDLADEY